MKLVFLCETMTLLALKMDMLAERFLKVTFITITYWYKKDFAARYGSKNIHFL